VDDIIKSVFFCRGIPLLSQRNHGLSIDSTSVSGLSLCSIFSPWLLQLDKFLLHRIEFSLAMSSSSM
jgi:hypothetical protein